MASYAAAVDIFRSSAAAAAAGGVGIEGVAAEDMAAMQALMEEDENNPGAFAMAEDESLDYDVRLLQEHKKKYIVANDGCEKVKSLLHLTIVLELGTTAAGVRTPSVSMRRDMVTLG